MLDRQILRVSMHQGQHAAFTLQQLTHGRTVKLPIRLDIRNYFLIHWPIGAIWDQAFGVLQLAELVPHASPISNDKRHAVIDDSVLNRMNK